MEIIAAKRPDSDIRPKVRAIVIVVGALIVGMWVAVGLSVVTSRQTAVLDASQEGRNLMIAFREEVAHILLGVEGETNLLAERLRRERGNFDLYTWGQENLVVSHGIMQISFIDPQGKLKSTTLEAHPRLIDLTDRGHIRIHLDGRFPGLFIGQSIIGRLSAVPQIPISRRVDAQDGTFLGILVVFISPSALTSLHKSVDLGPHGVMTLAGLDHIIRARFSADSPEGVKGIGDSIAGGPRPATMGDNAEGWFVRTSVIDGINRLYTFGRVGSYPLVVTIGLDQHQELAAWRSRTWVIVVMAIGGTLLLIGLAAYLSCDARRVRGAALQMTYTAEHDLLTGLPNRTLLNDRITQAIALAQRHKEKLAVLFLDLDHFKNINDSLGHTIGDKLLQSVAERLVSAVRGSDTVSRQGGDEFLVLLSEVRHSEHPENAVGRILQPAAEIPSDTQGDSQLDVAIAARRMLQAVAAVNSLDHHELHITASIGISIYPFDGTDAETLIQNADTAMYQAKENGRSGYRFFKPTMNVVAVERQAIEESLRRALERQELAVHYQPKVDLRTGAVTGAEALLRWTHPTRGSVSPAQFIPVAEDCGLILPIGAWVLREACQQARAWLDAGLPEMTIAVNVSAMQFRNEDFLKDLSTILSETGLDPKFLEVELTESGLMKNAVAAASVLQTLREKGVRVSIDDFGTGYSSLSYLRKFPVDALKIDQSFVREISAAHKDTAIVTAVIGMAQSLDLRVIAEGVETLEQLNFLRSHQCDEAQGYYFSRPVPAEQFAEFLKTGRPGAETIRCSVLRALESSTAESN